VRPVGHRYLRDLFAVRVAFEPAWRVRRWGSPDALAAAFAADQGL
jgi:hypothetical protein